MNFDLKSFIIGILLTLLIISIAGFKQEKNLGDIVVNSITLKNPKGKVLGEMGYSDKDSVVFIRLLDYNKNVVTSISSVDLGGTIFLRGYDKKSSLGLLGIGVVQVTNDKEKVVATFGNDITTRSASLNLRTNDNKGGIQLFSIYDDSFITILDENGRRRTEIKYDAIVRYNSKNNMITWISENENGDGQIVLSDRYGDFGWGATGK